MKSILLAVDGLMPSKRAFGYALELCRRTRAGLQVLQIVQARHLRDIAGRLKEGASNAGSSFEAIMAAAAFAEAGEARAAQELLQELQGRLEQMIPAEDRGTIPVKALLATGHPEKEIPRFIEDHPGVLMAVYNNVGHRDRSSQRPSCKTTGWNLIRKALPVPLLLFSDSQKDLSAGSKVHGSNKKIRQD